MAEPLHFTQGLCPLPYLLLRHLLVGEELINFPVVLEAPGKEEDHAAYHPAPSLQPHSHKLSEPRGRPLNSQTGTWASRM